MNRSLFLLPLLAAVCCIGIPLLLAGAGISIFATVKGGVFVGTATFIAAAAAMLIYVSAKRRR